jgi:uncharacterized membrane protein
MSFLIAGLVLFLGIHLVPMAPGLRARLLERYGDRRYRAIFSLFAASGLVLIIVGWHLRPERAQLFAPLAAARSAAPAVVTIAFILFAAANMKTHIRSIVRHPMLIGLILWSGIHLLANGDLAGTVLFGSFLAYAIVDLLSAARRVRPLPAPESKYDLMAVAGGLALALATMHIHPYIFGTPPVV